MGTNLVVLVVVTLVILGAVGFAVALARKGRERAEWARTVEARLAERTRTIEAGPVGPLPVVEAPAEWAGADTREAKLHRRLVAASRALSAQPLGDPAAIERRAATEEQIVELEQVLIRMAPDPESFGPRNTEFGIRIDEMIARLIEPSVGAIEWAVAEQANAALVQDILRRIRAEMHGGGDGLT